MQMPFHVHNNKQQQLDTFYFILQKEALSFEIKAITEFRFFWGRICHNLRFTTFCWGW